VVLPVVEDFEAGDFVVPPEEDSVEAEVLNV